MGNINPITLNTIRKIAIAERRTITATFDELVTLYLGNNPKLKEDVKDVIL